MPRYSDYEKKLAPWVKAKNFVVRHRVVLICLASAAICTAAALTSTKGVVKDETIVSDSITYGELPSYSASAFMGGVSYEFSPAEEENWSSVVPEEVGKYKMRAKSGNSFGGNYYGSVHYFSIDPYKTTCSLASTSYSYGSKPYVSIELVGKDKVASYDIVYDDISKENPVASITNLKIENENGGDATSNYDITFSSSEVSLSKQSLYLTFKNKSFVFDGKEHSLEEDFYTLNGKLAEGDEIVFETNSLINVGSIASAKEGSIKVLRDKTYDVTKHYDIVTNYGSLNVTKAPLSLASVSASKEYDGNPFGKEEYESVSKIGLQGGDEVSVVYDGNQSSSIVPGTYENHFSYSFASGLEDNYQINEEYGKLTITKRKLGVKISGTHAYAGSKFAGIIPSSEIAYSGSGLLSGHTASFVVEESEEDNCLSSRPNVVAKILDAEGHDVTSYYEIALDSDSLRYQKRKATVTAKDVSFVYDGKEHQGEFEYAGLAEGDVILYSEEPYLAKDLPSNSNVLTYEYTPKVKGIYRNGEDRTKYYDISLVKGTFTLSARPLSIRLEVNRSYKDYGTGIEDSLSAAEYSLINDTSLVEGHSMEISIDKASDVYTDPKFDVKVYDESGKDATHNYAIQRSGDDIAFSKSQILLSGYEDVNFDYNGTEWQINPTISGLRGGDALQWAEGYAPSDHKEFRAGSYSFELKIGKIVNSFGEDVSRHYVYESSYLARMTINKAGLVTSTLVTSRTYEGRDYTEISWEEGTDYTFAGLEFTDKGTITLNECPFLNKGTTNFDVTITNTIYNAKVNDCYEGITKLNANNITWEKGSLSVAAKPELNPSVIYDGSSHLAMVSVEGLEKNDVVSFTCNGNSSTSYGNGNTSFTIPNPEVGTYPINVSITKVFHSSNQQDASAYYSSLTAVNGGLTITKRPLELKIYEHGSDWTHDLYWDGICYTTEGGTSLAPSQKLSFTYERTEEGKVKYVPHIYDSSNVEVTSNYSIVLDGSDVFNRIPLTVSYSDETIVYDGQDHYLKPKVTGVPGNCTLKDETISLKSNPSEHQLRYAGESYTYTPEVLSIKDGQGRDETALYDVSCVSGTLSIAKRPLNITISGSRVYEGYLFSATSLSGSEYQVTNSGADSGLASGDHLTITPIDDGSGSIIGDADADDFEVKITCNGSDRTANYDIALAVSYTFEKADVSIQKDGGEWTYDAEEHQGNASASAEGSDIAMATSDCEKQTEAGTYSYTITVSSVTSSNGEDRSAYYNLPASENASFTIVKKDASIRFPFGYVFSTRANGTPKDLNAEFKNFSSNIQFRGLPDGFRVTDYVFKDGPSTAGTFQFADYLSSYKILNEAGEDKTANFNVAITGSFTVKEKLEVGIYFRNQSKAYDGKAFELKGNFFSYSIAPTGEKDDFKVWYVEESALMPSDINVGTYSAKMLSSYFYLTDKKGNEVADTEYVITLKNELNLTITQCSMTFSTPDLIGYCFEDEPAKLSPGEAKVASSSTSVKALGNNRFRCNNGDIITLIPPVDNWEFKEATSEDNPATNGSSSEPWTYKVTRNGVDVTANYNISFVYGGINVYFVSF